MNASSRQRHRLDRPQQTSTESGRATKVSTSPAAMAIADLLEVIRPGETQQPEHHEQPDLGQPGHALGERPGGRPVRQLGVAEDQRRDVDRGEARRRARPRCRRTRARSGTAPPAGRGPSRQRGAAQQPGAAEPDHQARPATPMPSSQTISPAKPRTPWLAPTLTRVTRTIVGRVVEAGLGLERAGQPPRQRHPAQHREDRGGVGRRGDRAEQHRELPAQAEHEVREQRPSPARCTATPTVASETPSRITGRISGQVVVRPPSARIRTSAAKPSACASSASSNSSPSPASPSTTPDQQVDQQARQPDADAERAPRGSRAAARPSRPGEPGRGCGRRVSSSWHLGGVGAERESRGLGSATDRRTASAGRPQGIAD